VKYCTEFPDSTIRDVGVGSLPSVVKNIVALAVSHVKTNVAEIAKVEPNGRISGVFVFGCKVNLALTGAESAYPPFFVRAVRCTTPARVRVCECACEGEGREWKVGRWGKLCVEGK
jgi:hypothetical protein